MSSLYFARRFGQALAAADEATALKPNSHEVGLYTYGSFLALGQPEKARLLCESPLAPMLLDEDNRYECFAFVYHRLGHPGEARKALQNLMSKYGDTRAFSYAEIYSQWGDSAAALRWLSTAVRARNPATALLKVDWMLDPVRNEPEFKALLAHMNFPP